MSQIAVRRGPQRDRRRDGRSCRAVRRPGCTDRVIPFQGDYFHPTSLDGAPGIATAHVRRFHFRHGVIRSTEGERASKVSCQVLNAPPERISEGDHIPPFHQARSSRQERIGRFPRESSETPDSRWHFTTFSNTDSNTIGVHVVCISHHWRWFAERGLTPAQVLPKPSQSSLTYVGSVGRGGFSFV